MATYLYCAPTAAWLRSTFDRPPPPPCACLPEGHAFPSKQKPPNNIWGQVEGDGNCLYRALATQLTGREGEHAWLRERLFARLRSERAVLEGVLRGRTADNDYDKFVNGSARLTAAHAGQTDRWGGDEALWCFCTAFECVVLVWSTEQGLWTPFYDVRLRTRRMTTLPINTGRPTLVVLNEHNHYRPIVMSPLPPPPPPLLNVAAAASTSSSSSSARILPLSSFGRLLAAETLSSPPPPPIVVQQPLTGFAALMAATNRSAASTKRSAAPTTSRSTAPLSPRSAASASVTMPPTKRRRLSAAAVTAPLSNIVVPMESMRKRAAVRNEYSGNIGSAVALRARAFGFDLCYYETGLAVGRDKALGVRCCGSLDQLLRQSDCVTLHCPMTAASRHLIDAKAIGRMKQGAFVVNTSRGGLIDETALAEALKTGKLAGAALDVHENEPYDATKGSLRDAPNLICTPHSAWFSPQSKNEQRTMAAEEALRAIEANPHESLAQVLRTCVNRQMLMQFGK